MLPTVVANELQEAVSDFLRSAFPFSTPYFQLEGDHTELIDQLIHSPGSIFQGPYLDIKLPFRLAEEAEQPFRHLSLPFTPYRHQMQAFKRLVGNAPQSSIVATGTGSGKTECFMLPVLDDCLERREQGIKTIVIYPMNALATDQARRFAEETAKLDTRLTVGLFVGGETKSAESAMGPHNVITCHKTLRHNPPDILLTNYKMLDFLLIRPKDQPLWRFNKPGMLRYLVVDELHTFDGAQGTDLACLVRRLRDRLEAGSELACVGTSATMGADSKAELLEYAAQVFATELDDDAIIGEDRLTPEEYLLGFDEQQKERALQAIEYHHWPAGNEPLLNPDRYERFKDYLFHQARLWFPGVAASELSGLQSDQPRKQAQARVRLGELLYRHQVFHQLVRDAESLTHVQSLSRDWQQDLGLESQDQALRLIMSLTSLIAAAREKDRFDHKDPSKWVRPFLQLRQQMWLRELRRIVCAVPSERSPDLVLRFADDLKDPEDPLHLPLLHCRECHLGAWGGVQKKGDSHITGQLQLFYQDWFSHSPRATLLVPLADDEPSTGSERLLCAACRRLQAVAPNGHCVSCESEDLIRVWVPNLIKKPGRDQKQALRIKHDCPKCGARNAMAIVGYRAATLTSVMTGRLFSTPYNDDYKLIAFSDSVQDAAHRAGFLGANTWRTVVRQAVARWLGEQPVAMSLSDMAAMLPDYWRDKMQDDAHFCGLFIAPNMAWYRDYAYLTEHGRLPSGSDLVAHVSQRLAWECITEFGRRAGVGRSLQRSGHATVAWDEQRLAADVKKLATVWREELEPLREISDEVCLTFVRGWLERARSVGAIYVSVMDPYLNEKGKEYMLNRLSWMPGYGRTQRPPAAMTLAHVANNFEAAVQGNRETWSMRWLKETLGDEALFAGAEAKQLFKLMFDHLTKAGWLTEKEVAGESVWLLVPERILISSGSVSHRIYGVTEPRRLVPSEHTGLLPRDLREKVERSFIEGQEPWDVNLLSATPTLEMGINIGDLSSVFLCSVPPAQANYLQRIGRAGRRDGNALAVTIANGENHDLYFYQEPMEMMAGSVHTPGVFLKAIAVLERQLIAYSFDRWTGTGIDDTAIPGTLRKVLDAVEHSHEEQFPYDLLRFIETHRDALLADFLKLFPDLEEDEQKYLAGFIQSEGEGTLGWKVLNRLQLKVDQRASLLVRVRKLKKESERLKAMPEDEATQETLQTLEQERSAMMSLLYALNNQLVLNFFTDEGLLPNYAFPEEGVTLSSVILKRRSKEDRKDEDSAFEKTPYVFQRPAQAALGELAPESRFYAVSHVMEIDQVDLQLSPLESWRFCNQCQYTERVDTGDPHSACPRCGSAQWADSGQRHDVVRLRQVYSTVDDRYGRISDDSERREPTFFNRQVLVDIADDGYRGGFRIKSDALPFGFEFLSRVILREVNFGPGGDDSHSFAVAGEERPRAGFRICRECGKVQKARPARNYQNHGFTCRLRTHPESEQPSDYLESLYLYRELNSEAIRILLPLSEVAYSDEKLHSFVAALNLGLKRYFRGDVNHLEVTSMREPPREGNSERIYLVIYDRIPGGTGYLKELMRQPDNLMSVLEHARQHLRQCACVDDEARDGCYRCILAYRNSRQMPTISRRQAEELLGQILALRDQLEAVEALSEISTNVLVESKLEQRFIDALKALPGARLAPVQLNGKNAHRLTLPAEDGSTAAWNVEHQIRLGPEQGVALHTEVDVLLSPVREADASRVLPIAVYMDGLQYHHSIVADDVCKRTAIIESGRFRVWTLGWDDLPATGTAAKPFRRDVLVAQGASEPNMAKMWQMVCEKHGWTPPHKLSAYQGWGGFQWLQRILRAPIETTALLKHRATWRAFASLLPTRAGDTALRQKLQYEIAENAATPVVERLACEQPSQVFGGFMDAYGNSPGDLEICTSVAMSAIQSNDPEMISQQMILHLCFDDRSSELNDTFKDSWRGFWHAVNQLQYLSQFSFSTRKAVSEGRMESLYHKAEEVTERAESMSELGDERSEGWADVFEECLLDQAVLEQILALELPEPEVGVDLTDDSGAVIVDGSVIELCWRQQKVAVITEAPDKTPEQWVVLRDDEGLIENLELLKQQGVF